MKTLDVGYINKNRQKNLGCKGKSETHYNQNSYEMECLDCGHKYSRTISDKLRYQVLKRDNFKCCACGASPAKDPSVELHIDHIVPWSKGGENTAENLQTLCSKCNLGKSNDL